MAARKSKTPSSDLDLDVSRHLFAALPVALLLPFVAALALGIRALFASPRFSTATLFMVLATSFLATFVLLMRRRLPRAGVLAACHVLTWVPLVALGAAQLVRDGIVPEVMGCTLGSNGGLFTNSLPFGGLAFLALGTAVGILLSRRTAARILRVAALVSVAVASIVSIAAVRLAFVRPDPDTYVSSLPVVAELHAGESVKVGQHVIGYDRKLVIEPIPAPRFDGDPPPGEHAECRVSGLYISTSAYPGYSSCPVLKVFADPVADVGLIEGVYPLAAQPYLAFRPSDGSPISVTALTIPGGLAPPLGWTIGGGIAALVGLGCLLGARGLRRRATEVDGCEATHTGNGWVTLPTGERLRVDAVASLPEGDVVLGAATHAMPTYRIAGGPAFGRAWAGKLADLRTARLDLAASIEAIALASAALGAAPLVAARVLGWLV